MKIVYRLAWQKRSFANSVRPLRCYIVTLVNVFNSNTMSSYIVTLSVSSALHLFFTLVFCVVYGAEENKNHVNDLHATMLSLLGLDSFEMT